MATARKRRPKIKPPQTIIAIGDVHAPFTDIKALNRLLDDIKTIKPDAVVQMGDLYDFYSFSSFSPSRYGHRPIDELTEARGLAETMWGAVRDAAPKAKCYQLLGNHDLRIRKQLVKKAPEMEALLDVLDFESLWRFPGVQLQADYREPLELGGTLFLHGYGKSGAHFRHYLQSVVVGHLHLGAVHWMNMKGNKPIFELNAGFIGDRNSMAFAYPETKLVNWTAGYGLITERGPQFVAL